jgi:2-dehydro-3-deoxyphosphogluconate aldolase / (4S)-4-hydroxy-2-oxoglutarate aldolase
MFPQPLIDDLHRLGILAVVTADTPIAGVATARALLAGGVSCMELTLRTPAALDVVKAVIMEVPGMKVGVGTILTPEQAEQAQAAGAAFGVAPGMNPRVVKAAAALGLPFAPGVCTPSDIELALEQGCRVMKFFPAEPCGGLAYLKVVSAPFMHLGVRFLPLGGVNASNAVSYLSEPSVLALGGSWLAPQGMIQQERWSEIQENAAKAKALTRSIRPDGRRL